MKKNTLIICISIFTVMFFGSCKTLLYTNIEVLRPAQVAFPLDVDNVLIVNNSVPQPENVGHTTRLINEDTRTVELPADSLSIFLTTSLAEEIASRQFFGTTQLIHETVNTTSDYTANKPLSSYNVSRLCTAYNADAIISLNKLEVSDVLEEFYLSGYGFYLLELNTVYHSYWSIQHPNKTIIDTLQFADTVHWAAESTSRRRLFENFPKRYDALIDGALYVGGKSANRFIPYWEEVDRYFFVNNNDWIKKGMNAVYEQEWDNAIEIWKQALLETKKKKDRAYIANNLAVVYEISGDIENAYRCMDVSVTSYKELLFSNSKDFRILLGYLQELEQRYRDNLAVEKQVGE